MRTENQGNLQMTVQVLDSIALWDGTPGVILTPLGFGVSVVEDNDPPEALHDACFGNYPSQVRLGVDEGLVETAWRMERLL